MTQKKILMLSVSAGAGHARAAECLAMGLPMIVNSPIPGQEERNADHLLEQGVALKACDAVTLEYRVRLLLDRPAMLAGMAAKARALGRPDAASRVLAHVLRQPRPADVIPDSAGPRRSVRPLAEAGK